MDYLTNLPEATAKGFSRAAWLISRPAGLAQLMNDTTQFAYNTLKHSSRDEWAIELDPTPLSRNALVAQQLQIDPSDVAAIYTGIATQSEIDTVVQYIIDNDYISIIDMIPDSMQPFQKTRAELIADGWFG